LGIILRRTVESPEQFQEFPRYGHHRLLTGHAGSFLGVVTQLRVEMLALIRQLATRYRHPIFVTYVLPEAGDFDSQLREAGACVSHEAPFCIKHCEQFAERVRQIRRG